MDSRDFTGNRKSLSTVPERRSIRTKREPEPARGPGAPEPGVAPRAASYPALIPEGNYLASCVSAFGPHRSRTFGERIYLEFAILEGQYAGTKLRAFFRPSKYPTSNWYRAWCIAHDGLPTRNAKMTPRKFSGKTFTVQVSTVRPRQRVTSDDGKIRSGDPLPEFFAYSKVASILSLEITNERASQ